jgi:hypothetical protein
VIQVKPFYEKKSFGFSNAKLFCLLSVFIVASALFFGVVSAASAAGQDVTLTLHSTSTELPQNKAIYLSGEFSAPVTGVVTLQWGIDNSGFIYNYYNVTVSNGVVSGRDFGFARPGNWSFRLLWQGNSQYNSAVSNAINVNVLPAQAEEDTDYTIYLVIAAVAIVFVVLGAFMYTKRKKKQIASSH